MAQVKLEFTKKTESDKITSTEVIISSLTDNPHFKKPTPSVPELQAGLDKFKTAFKDAKNGGVDRTDLKKEAGKELDKLISRLISHIQSESGGDPIKIRSAGMDIKSDPVIITSMDIPQSLEAYIGNPTEVDLVWKPVYKALSYEIQMTLDPTDASTWTIKAASTVAKYTITNLESGKRYWFRVAALGPRNLKSTFSDPASGMAG